MIEDMDSNETEVCPIKKALVFPHRWQVSLIGLWDQIPLAARPWTMLRLLIYFYFH